MVVMVTQHSIKSSFGAAYSDLPQSNHRNVAEYIRVCISVRLVGCSIDKQNLLILLIQSWHVQCIYNLCRPRATESGEKKFHCQPPSESMLKYNLRGTPCTEYDEPFNLTRKYPTISINVSGIVYGSVAT